MKTSINKSVISLMALSFFFSSFAIAQKKTNMLTTIEQNTNRPGKDYKNVVLPKADPNQCAELCKNDPKCKAYTYVKPGVQGRKAKCWLKSEVPKSVINDCCFSGIKLFSDSQLINQGQIVLNNLMMEGVIDNKLLLQSVRGWQSNWAFTKSNINLPGRDYKTIKLPSSEPVPQRCEYLCLGDIKCKAWTYVLPGVQGPDAYCWLKSAIPSIEHTGDCISGLKRSTLISALPSKELLSSINQAQKVQLQKFDQEFEKNIETKIGNSPQKILNAQEVHLINLKQKNSLKARQLTAATQNQINSIPTIDLSKVMKPPKISRVKSLVTKKSWQEKAGNDGVYDRHYLIIYGENFGDCTDGNCGVKLEYTQIKEFVKEMPKFSVDLIPFNDNWKYSWHDDFIVAYVPMLRQDLGELGYSANLVIWRGGQKSFVQKHQVYRHEAGASIGYIQRAPNYSDGHLAPNSEVWVHGDGFGNTNGELFLYAPFVPDNILTNQEKRINLQILKWTDELIHAKVPNLKGNYEVGGAEIHVIDNQFKKHNYTSTSFGPEMVLTQISGKDFIQLSEPGCKNKIIEKNGFLLVRHDPDCGISGCNGTDYFFLDKPLPHNVNIIAPIVIVVNPDSETLLYKWLGNKMIDVGVSILTEDGIGFLKEVGQFLGEVLLRSFGVGKYGAYVKIPTVVTPYVYVNWNNTCMFEYDDVPLNYMTTFFLKGPKGYTPGSPTDLSEMYKLKTVNKLKMKQF